MRKKNKKTYDNGWPIVAICYDFDKTLSPKDMQEYGLISKLGCTAAEFWEESGKMAHEQGMDKILAYMELILQKSGETIKVSRSDFTRLGKNVELYPGVSDWFDRLNAIAAKFQINLEHYIISAGLKEIIEGSPIASKIDGIYASTFRYDAYKRPIWPCQVVNYTTKTQYLFRISKDCLDLGDEDAVNEYMDDSMRRIPFKNMIYIGDSETDIPAMRVVKNRGGISIGVYDPHTFNMDSVRKLLNQNRIDLFAPADYSAGSRLEHLVTLALSKMRADSELDGWHFGQLHYVDSMERIEAFVDYTKDYLATEDVDEERVDDLRRQARNIVNRMRRELLTDYNELASDEEVNAFMDRIYKEIRSLMTLKKKQLKQTRCKTGNKLLAEPKKEND